MWVIFALLDPDPDPLTRLNPDPIRIRNPAFSSTLFKRLVSSAVAAKGWPVRLAWIRIRFATPDKPEMSNSKNVLKTGFANIQRKHGKVSE